MVNAIGFFAPENVGLGTGFTIVCHLEPEILRNMYFQLSTLNKSKMTAHTWVLDRLHLFAMSTITSLVPENVLLATGIGILGHLEAKIFRNFHLKVAIFKNSRWPPYNYPGKWKHVFPDLLFYKVSKNV